MEIKHFDDGKKGHWKAIENSTEAGIMTYVWAGGDKFIIEHTIGNPDFKGVGMKLLDKAVAYARENNKKIVPLCPFAKKMFDRKEDIRDVLA
ncbi:GNAT family N-acetyltransferase [Flavobacterium cyanobacteriorum]|uniref:GNAT family N-acetyltransferase n=1 Tax=Flavobacterium cyanobacteriorum TaxID=2022802 RepID=A0A256A125_9FLAO|nr:GNAT family N-acetyltransferase [Flavobacterium cyanobacteriorum]OYQ46804.1 GNAT family N-acetyltransferase [Flavobacterium cyanobacteriorum]